MAPKTPTPATLAAGRDLGNMFCLAANNPEISQDASKIQEIRAAFVARKCGVSHEIAMIIAPLAFGLEVTQ